MRLLIAQGPGYYGVNIRILSDEEATALEPVMTKLDTAYEVAPPNSGPTHVHNIEDTSVYLTSKIDIHKSSGFDSGWWTEGETALDAIIEKARIHAADEGKG